MRWPKLFGGRGPRPSRDDRNAPVAGLAGQLNNPAEMAAFANELLNRGCKACGAPDLAEGIEIVHEERGRTLAQSFPLRCDLYDLDDTQGAFLFRMQCGAGTRERTLIDVASYRVGARRFGAYVYGLGHFPCEPPTSPLVGSSYDVPADVERLKQSLGTVDAAYSIPWLRKLYVETFQMIFEMIGRGETTMELAERLSVFRDATLDGIFDRMVLRQSDPEQADMLSNIISTFRTAYEEAERDYGNLRDNRIVQYLFAMQSGLYTSFGPEAVETYFSSRVDSSDLEADIRQCSDLIVLATWADASDLIDMAELTVAAARYAESNQLGHALVGLAATLSNTDEPDTLERALGLYREAYALAKGSADSNLIDGARLNIQRLSTRLQGEPDPGDVLPFDPAEKEVLRRYNAFIAAGDLRGALEALEVFVEGRKPGADAVELLSLKGLLLVGFDRLPEAFKVLNQCENLVAKELAALPESGTFELFKTALSLNSGRVHEAARVAREALHRLGNSVTVERQIDLANALCAAALDEDPAETVDVGRRFLQFARGRDRLFLLSNIAAAQSNLGQYDEAQASLDRALSELSTIKAEDSLRFDLHFRAMSIAWRDGGEKKDVGRALEASDEALAYAAAVGSVKTRNLHIVRAQLFQALGVHEKSEIAALEAGFAAARRSFLAIARLEDDINDRFRLLNGYIAKVQTFRPFARLFDHYLSGGRLHEAYGHAQRYKSAFLLEALFSTSENLCAEQLAHHLGDMLAGNTSELQGLATLGQLSKLNPEAWRGSVESALRASGMIDERPLSRPLCNEQLDRELFLMATMQQDRATEIDRAMTLEFASACLPADTALVEFIPLETGVAALLVQNGTDLRMIGSYTIGDELERLIVGDWSSIGAEARQKALQGVLCGLSGFGGDLAYAVAPTVRTLIICPASWAWLTPFCALPHASGTLGDHFRIVHSLSATVGALLALRPRRFGKSGCAIVDPLGELWLSPLESSMLASQGAVAFDRIIEHEIGRSGLDEAIREKFWLHVSAHGRADTSGIGLDASLEIARATGSRQGGLTALEIISTQIPGLFAGVVVLSACHAADFSRGVEEPVGIATSFLVGGAKAVIAPLWEVDELATLVFMSELYHYAGQHVGCLLSDAVRSAQSAVKTTSLADALEILRSLEDRPNVRDLSLYKSKLAAQYRLNECPFSDPFHWGAFVLVGSDIRLGP